MPKTNRIVVPGLPHHICHRGNNKQRIFFSTGDESFYLDLLRWYSQKHDLSIQAYCLMPNHIHVVATPPTPNTLRDVFERVHGEYAQAQHARLQRVGHFWQARFRSCPMDDFHFWAALAYVERNPVRARLVERADQWIWSSAADHLNPTPDSWLDMTSWSTRYTPQQWRDCLASGLANFTLDQRIRDATHAGVPAVSDSTRAQLEREFGRRLSAMPLGRPTTTSPAEAAGA